MAELKVSKANIELASKIFKTAMQFTYESEYFDCAITFEAHVKWFEYCIYPNGYDLESHNRIQEDIMMAHYTNKGLNDELNGILDLIVKEKADSDKRNSKDGAAKTKEKLRIEKIKRLKDSLEKLENEV